MPVQVQDIIPKDAAPEEAPLQKEAPQQEGAPQQEEAPAPKRKGRPPGARTDRSRQWGEYRTQKMYERQSRSQSHLLSLCA